MILKNTLREKIDAGKPTIGTHFLSSDPDIPEIIGDIGLFDYGEYDAEYSAFDMRLLYHLVRAGESGNLPLMIKLDQENQGFWAQVSIGAGFKSVLFTDIRSAEDVKRACKFVRPDCPDSHGKMGVKLRRPAFFYSQRGYEIDHYLEGLKSFVIAIMIEKDTAVDNIESVLEMAKSNNVDFTQWGPADFGFSRGEPNLMNTDQIRTFEELVIRKSIEFGIPPRIEISEVEDAKRYIDLGVRNFCIGWDRFIYQSTLYRLGEGMRKIVEDL